LHLLKLQFAGDGTNACNVDVQVYHPVLGTVTVKSLSRTDSTLGTYYVAIPCIVDTNVDSETPFVWIRLAVSGYGTFYFYRHTMSPMNELFYRLNGLKTESASNTSTTVTRYTLVDNNGRGNRYKQASVSLSSPSGGTAKLYINGVEVARMT